MFKREVGLLNGKKKDTCMNNRRQALKTLALVPLAAALPALAEANTAEVQNKRRETPQKDMHRFERLGFRE